MIDGETYTNKFGLLLAWKWDFDAKGFNVSDLSLLTDDPKLIICRACPRYGRTMKEYRIDLTTDVLTITDVNPCTTMKVLTSPSTHDILFGEICLFPDI
jgi:hypothetical protein